MLSTRVCAKRSKAWLGWSLITASCATLSIGCHSDASKPAEAETETGGSPPADAAIENFCDLPGTVRFTPAGTVNVPGNELSRIGFLHLPVGYCVHYYGNVPNARQLRFAPGGELFVASPTTGTTGGGNGGKQAIVILPDDDRDGYSDPALDFLSNLPSTQGLLFTADHFYYQDGTKILRLPYRSGDRSPSGASEVMADIRVYSSDLHWPKPLDQADDGTIYVGNGGDQSEACEEPHPFRGGILKLDGTMAGAQVAKGFRNPIAVRCARGKNLCFAVELALDYSEQTGGREKLVPIRAGDDWGFPCCATRGLPFLNANLDPDCSHVASEDAAFLIGDTPFSFDFEPGKWPAPYTGAAFVPLHGAAGSWQGARVVAIAMNPKTGLPLPSDDLNGGMASGGLADFASGYDDRRLAHGRPAAVTFAPDGRLFLGNDNDGNIFWIAPLDLPIPRD